MWKRSVGQNKKQKRGAGRYYAENRVYFYCKKPMYNSTHQNPKPSPQRGHLMRRRVPRPRARRHRVRMLVRAIPLARPTGAVPAVPDAAAAEERLRALRGQRGRRREGPGHAEVRAGGRDVRGGVQRAAGVRAVVRGRRVQVRVLPMSMTMTMALLLMMMVLVGERADGRVRGRERAREADHLARAERVRVAGERVRGVEEHDVPRGHARAPPRVEHARPRGRAVRQVRLRAAARRALRGREDASPRLPDAVSTMHSVKCTMRRTHVDHPVGHLRHAEPRRVAQLLLLLLARVRVVRMAVQPVLEEVRHRLRQLPALARRPLHQAR